MAGGHPHPAPLLSGNLRLARQLFIPDCIPLNTFFMAYFLYTRKSQEDEARQIQSIGDQLKLARELADAAGITISQIFQEAYLAKRPGRPVFHEMIARIEAGEADGIIARHPDRLARNAVDAGLLIDRVACFRIAPPCACSSARAASTASYDVRPNAKCS